MISITCRQRDAQRAEDILWNVKKQSFEGTDRFSAEEPSQRHEEEQRMTGTLSGR